LSNIIPLGARSHESLGSPSLFNSFLNFESLLQKLRPEDFHLHRIQKFLDLAGNPAKNLKIVHVAGTKGKGSTCAFLAGILQEPATRSDCIPLLIYIRVNERIRILNSDNLHSKEEFSGAISDDDLASILTLLRPVAAAIQIKVTFLLILKS